MSTVTPKNRLLFFTFMCISFLQMVPYALTPGIAKINAEVFPELPLSTIQTAMTLPSLLAMVMAIVSAWIVEKGLLTKKAMVLVGITLMSLTGVVVLVAHYQFWHLCLLSVLIGSGLGLLIAPSASIIFDRFNADEVRLAVGLQSSAINLGGIVMSISGGLLAAMVWYGGYFTLLIAIPVIILCAITIPGDKKHTVTTAGAEASPNKKKSKLPIDVFYFGTIMFAFSLVFPVCGTNISNHLMTAGIGSTALAGIATAAQMAGGVLSGLFFNRLSAKFKDMLLPIAFGLIFIGLTLLSLGQRLLVVDLVGVFIVGTAISIIVPQTLFSISKQVDSSNSATALTIVNCVLPGLGGFLSPVVFTNLTTAFGGPSTSFRYAFVSVVSFVLGALLLLLTLRRNTREKVPFAVAE